MNKTVLSGGLIVVAFALFGGAFLLAPSLQTDQAQATDEVRRDVERARRLLARVGENEDRLAMVIEELRLAGIEDIDEDQVAGLVEDDRDILTGAEERLQEIMRDLGSRRRDLQEKMQAAGGEVSPTGARGFGAGASQMEMALRAGLDARDRILNENEDLLDQALAAVREALAVQHGDLSGRDDPVALQTEGMILYAQGTASHRRARRLRDRACEPRADLVAWTAQLGQATQEQEVVQASDIDARIAEARARKAETQTVLDGFQATIDSLTGQITKLESQLAEQRSIADEARKALDRMAADGMDFADQQGLQKFSAMYGAQSKEYRQALRNAQIIEFGTLDNATIDDSHDFLKGEYVPANGSESVSPQRGLCHLRADLAEAQGQATAASDTLAALGEDITAMVQAREALAGRAAAAAGRADELREAAGDLYTRMSSLVAEAAEHEDSAIDKLSKAARSFNSAATAATKAGGEARDAISSLGPDAAQRTASYMRSEDRWTPASSKARYANASLRLAMVQYERYRDLTTDSRLTADLAGKGIQVEEDAAALAEAAQEARDQGLEAAQQAADTLLRVGRDLNQHYSITAEIASAYYLQSLFGEPGLVEYAIRNYQAVVEGREDDPNVRQYVERLEQLRRTGGRNSD